MNTDPVQDVNHIHIPGFQKRAPGITHGDDEETLTMPRFLMISPTSNWPGNAGGRIRSGKIAEALAALGPVRVLSLYHNQPLKTPPGLEEIVMRPAKHVVLWALRTTEHPLAPALPRMITARINRHIREFRPDVIVFEETVTTGTLKDLDLGNATTVFSSHNVDCDILPELEVIDATILENARKDEIAAIRGTDHVIACSQRDALRFEDMTAKKVFVLHNPIPDERCFEIPITPERYADTGILFVGSMDYAPNAQAVAEIVRDILPRLPDGTRLTLVGRRGDRLADELPENARITVLSDVPDLLEYLAEFAVSPMPIRSGGGTRLKALEAMAAGVVLIATEKAVEGLDLVPGTHYLPAETPEQFSAAFSSVQTRPAEMAQLARTARTFVREAYGGAAFERDLRHIFQAILAQRNGLAGSSAGHAAFAQSEPAMS